MPWFFAEKTEPCEEDEKGSIILDCQAPMTRHCCLVLAFVLCIACCALCFCWKAKRPGKRKYPGLRDIEDDGETRELGMKKGASARSWGNLEDPNRTALIKTESFGTSEKYMSARI